MNSKDALKQRNKVVKDMKAKPQKPGDLLTSKKKPSKRLIATLGLV